ncbi:ABC transporter permease [Mesorhizobium sp. GR13]|uniref:ABC transporter permease n=1 Tax=Mesorhizobium sp. GR13 TaxID=2562308 RepID=UPI0010C1224B|nr:ABC transporter permease [Mesorhizobium sp. GR13]
MKSKHLSRIFNTVLALYSVAVYVFLFAPILAIIAYSFNGGRLLLVWQEFSFAPYLRAFSNAQMTNSVVTSLQAAALATLIATILGSLAGLHIARRPGLSSTVFVSLISIVLVTPEIVNAVALLPWFVFLGVDASVPAFNSGLVRLAIGHAIFPTAVVTFVVRARMSGVNASLEEAAADLYATPFSRFRQITLPIMLPAIVAGGLLAATISMDNVIISSFVSVQGSSPWPVFVFGSLRSGMRPEIAALSTVMFIVVISVVAIAALILRWGEGSRQA